MKYIYIYSTLLFLSFISLFSQEKKLEDRSVVFEKIIVNKTEIPQKDWGEIVLGDKDSIFFFYFLDAGENKKTPFLFEISFFDGKDSYTSSVNLTKAQYRNLQEGVYEFSVGAFDQARGWKVPSKSIKFLVNNRFYHIKHENDSLKAAKAKLAPPVDPHKDKAEVSGFDFFALAIGFFAALIACSLAYFIKIKLSASPKKALNPEDINLETSDPNLVRLFDENLALKAELSAVRNQIDAMQSRGNEMKKRNKELEDQILRLQNTKEELESLQEQKDELFAMIIHDIKNPAALIKSLVELLRSYDLTAIEQQDVMNDIVATTKRIVALSHEVSRVLALEGGKLLLDMETVDIGMISKDVFTRNNARAKEKNLNFVFDVPDRLPLADVDPQKIDEALDNLISNAIKFTPSGGSVRLKGQKIDDSLVFEISDTGLGLSEEDLSKAFNRGAMLSAKPTAGESSTGLGLWIVKKLIEAHGGRVWVRSTLAKGSTFAFSVPLHHQIQKSKEVDMSK